MEQFGGLLINLSNDTCKSLKVWIMISSGMSSNRVAEG